MQVTKRSRNSGGHLPTSSLVQIPVLVFRVDPCSDRDTYNKKLYLHSQQRRPGRRNANFTNSQKITLAAMQIANSII